MRHLSFLPYIKLFSIQILRKIDTQAVSSSFYVTCSKKKGSRSEHISPVQLQDWCRTCGPTTTPRILILLESCIRELLSIFVKYVFEGGSFQNSLGCPSCIIHS